MTNMTQTSGTRGWANRVWQTGLLVAAAAIFGGTSDAMGASVWWEAEAADTHTFGKSWAFHPGDDAQKAVLSGGAWLQTAKGGGATASWTIEVPEDGTYNFWTRKFYKHGPFTWHFDDQPEQQCTRECKLLDYTKMRAGIGINWVPLGEVTLTKGSHTLHIAVDSDATTVGFDCWWLTTSGAVPKGKTPPSADLTTAASGGSSGTADTDSEPSGVTVGPDGDYLWWEAEAADTHTFGKRLDFAPANAKERSALSGGAWLQTGKGSGVTASWTIDVPKAGTYEFWTRKFYSHGPFTWRFNDQPEQYCSRKCTLQDYVSIRKFVAATWVDLGKVTLETGTNTLHIRADEDTTAIGFDCWVLSRPAFHPHGPNKPGMKYNRTEPGWFPFEPERDPYTQNALFDLRTLNQNRAGADGFLRADGADIVFDTTGKKVKLWSVNAGCSFAEDHAAADYLARKLAKYGVNMVRIHSPIHDNASNDPMSVNTKYLNSVHYFVAALAKQGIYTKFSFYFPLWFQVKECYELPGYDGTTDKKPYGLLFYHPRMQEIYKSWARGLLTTPNPYTGMTLAEDPAVGMVEIVNEDGLLFWTFLPYNGVPEESMVPLEERFGEWVRTKYGSIEAGLATWGDAGVAAKGADHPEAGRLGFYHPGFFSSADWAVRDRNPRRAADQLAFTIDVQRGFYEQMHGYFRNELGVKGMISASNWHTVDARNLGALEKYTYTVCDVIDRHGYFGSDHKGERASFTVSQGDTFRNRSGLLEPDSLTRELQYGNKPHMISEYNYPTPNRFRGEGVYMASTYGSLSGTDAFFYFAMHQSDWRTSNAKFPVYTPGVMGQFPAFAYIYREGIVKEGPVVAQLTYALKDLLEMKGTDLVDSGAAYMDALRKKDITGAKPTQIEMPNVVDPLAYYVGQVRVGFSHEHNDSKITDLAPYINHEQKTIHSPGGQLFWDWGKGYSTLNDPRAQGACGFLEAAGTLVLPDVTIESGNDYATVMVVALDGKPIRSSDRVLVQVMTEDRNYGWKESGGETNTVISTGQEPLLVKHPTGTVTVSFDDPGSLRVDALDMNGYPNEKLKRKQNHDGAIVVPLREDCLYYMITRMPPEKRELERLSLWKDTAPVGDEGKTESEDPTITLHHPERPNGTAVVICPGGGYGMLCKEPEGHGIAKWLNTQGITGIVLEYRLPRGKPTRPLYDVQQAIRVVRTKAPQWQLDPARIGVMGFSAGGHLASMAATHFTAADPDADDPVRRVSSRPDFGVLIYPVISMGEKGHGGSRANLLGRDATETLLKVYSGELQVTDETPPCFLAHAADDSVVSPDNSKLFHEALQAHGVASEYLVLPRGNHGLNGYKGPMWDAWQKRSIEWMAEQDLVPPQ